MIIVGIDYSFSKSGWSVCNINMKTGNIKLKKKNEVLKHENKRCLCRF